MSQFNLHSFHSGQRWLRFRNDDAETAPPYALMRCTGSYYADGLLIHKCTSEVVLNDYGEIHVPGNFFSSEFHFLNGPAEVESGKLGYCTQHYPAVCRWAADIMPTNQTMMGPFGLYWSLTDIETADYGDHDPAAILDVDAYPVLGVISSNAPPDNNGSPATDFGGLLVVGKPSIVYVSFAL